jgi:hypothetical protein
MFASGGADLSMVANTTTVDDLQDWSAPANKSVI